MEKCPVCNYTPKTKEEETKGFKYACCKTLVTDLPASGLEVLCCTYNYSTGEFMSPVKDVSTDPNSFKENFIKKYEQKGCKDKPG